MEKNNRLFFRCQIFGWGGMIAANLMVRSFSSQGISAPDLSANIVFGLLAILVTTLLRNGFHQTKIHRLPVKKLVLILVPVSLMTAALIVLPGAHLSVLISGLLGTPIEVTTETYLSNYFNLLIVIVLWLALYFAIHYFVIAKQREVDALRLAHNLKEAQLNQLKSQLNPHFIFNSLNNIRGLVYEDADKTSEMITHLSELLRHSMTSKSDCHSLEDEIKILNNYIEINSIQFEDRLSFMLNCDQQCYAQPVPVMLLQMLAENAIKHGISRLPSGGSLSISIFRYDDNLCIEASNSRSSSPQVGRESTGIGIKNLKERLHLLYPGRASFELVQKDDVVVATVTLPWSEQVERSDC